MGDQPDDIVLEEQMALAKVTAQLAEIPPAKTASQAPIIRELERLRERLLSGDENKDLSTLSEQYHNQSAILDQLQNAGHAIQVDASSPYFAHLRLEEEGGQRDVYLGRTTCLEKGVRIIDWRDAPISKIFYSYRQGEEFDEEISGRERQGSVLVRRMLRIRASVLERVQAPEGDFRLDTREPTGWSTESLESPRLSGGESAALRYELDDLGLSRRMGEGRDGEVLRADKHLPEITSLIDPSQFDLITRPASGYLVIRGSAGSGKTTVALHRIAYLAFDDPRIDGPDTLVVVFSNALARYVAHVLPSLGLRAVRILTYRDWVHGERRRCFPELPVAVCEETPAMVQRLKLHSGMDVALTRQVARVSGPRTSDQAFDDWASILTQRHFLGDVFEEVAPGQFSERDLDRFVEWNRRRLDELSSAMAGDGEADAGLDPEDDALLLRAYQLRVGKLAGRSGRPLNYRHIVIDEVQDFAPIEVRVLLASMQRESSITLAGDTQQHLMEHSGFTSWRGFFDDLGLSGAEIETLKVSYRSSEQIMNFATSLLGDLHEEDDVVTTRTGPPVEFFRLTDRGACVAFLSDVLRDLMEAEPNASVAILTPSPVASDVYFEGLERAELLLLRRIRDGEFPFTAGIEVTEITQVKGLEFDYVIVLDVDASNYPDTPAARRLLHVAATRAVHQLWLMSVGTPSPLVEAVDAR
ncbi:MAG: ATP-binding domain-containing protein [Myxococcales bacterium]|nr:DNA helicase UvrD [Myxococcales bacterium]HIK86237.1 DNA helicase UvrD [Myxococcales bacterium]